VPYGHDLKVMLELAKLRKKIRSQRGSLDFDLPEAEIVLDLQGKPEEIVRSKRNWAHQMIEEFMLVANEAAAFWLSKKRRPTIYRVHEAPSLKTMHQFQEFIANFNQGITLSDELVQPKTLQALLGRIDGLPEEAVINHVLLRSLPQAYYSVENLGHFGLATDYYCHFTSPIRRYPDLVVHRIIKQEIKKSQHEQLGVTSLDTIAQECSVSERRAMEAERDIINLKKCQYMSTRVGETYHGMVTSVHPFGCFVELRDVFVEGLIHIASLENDYYHYEDDCQRLIGANRRQEFTIGTRVIVRVHKVDLERREIDFRIVEESDTNTFQKKAQRKKK
jgi:ribonuclease R